MSEFVVVDASVAFKWLVEEENSDKATALVRLSDDDGVQLAAPTIMPFEVANALHRRVVRGDLSLETAVELIQRLISIGVKLHQPLSIHQRALQLANQFSQGAVYDAHYLALAETLDCEMWTADRKFHRANRQAAQNVRWIGDLVV